MKSKPIKSTNPPTEAAMKLEQKNIGLQIQVSGFKNKILELKHKSLQVEQEIAELQKAKLKIIHTHNEFSYEEFPNEQGYFLH